MSELTVTLLRFGFLALLWVMILAVVLTQGRDLSVDRRRRRSSARSGQQRRGAAPAPAAAGPAPRHLPSTLVVLQGPTGGRAHQLGSVPVTMGRSSECDIPLEDDYASGRHARLFPQGTRWFLEDLGSTNGTFVDGKRITSATPLRIGQPVRIGTTTFELRR